MKSLIYKASSGQLREKVEIAFGRWGRFSYRNPWKIILPITFVLVYLYSHLSTLQVDTTMESFFHEDDPTRVNYNHFREQFGRDDNIIVAIETDQDIFTYPFLKRLQDFHQAVEERVPLVEEVQSLINARQTIGIEDELVVRDFLETVPESTTALNQLKQSAQNNPVYVGSFISNNSKVAALIIKNETFRNTESDVLDDALLEGFETEKSTAPISNKHKEYLNQYDNTAILQALDQLKSEFETEHFRIYISGGPYSTAWFLDTVRNNMTQFTGLAILIVASFLFIIFRRLVIVVVPLGIAVLSMLASMSLVAALDYRVSFSMQIVPSFLIAVGVGNCVHVFTVFFQAARRGESKEDSLIYSMQHSGLAILMTGLTTAGSLLAFTFSDMKPIAEFGIMTPLGVIFALFFSLVLLPAVITVFPINLVKQKEEKTSLIKKLLVSCGLFASKHAGAVLGIWLIASAAALFYASKLQFSFHIYNNLPPDHFLLDATRKIDDHMAGIGSWELIIDSGKENGVKDPVFLQRLEEAARLVDNYHFVKSVSILDINRELHQALHANNPAFYTIPDDPALIAQELFLFENSGADDLEKVVDSQFRYARLSMQGPIMDGVLLKPVLKQALKDIEEILGDDYSVTDTSLMRLTVNIFTEMPETMASSYLVSFMIITPLMIFLIGSLKVGLVSMLPNIIPIILTLGIMGIENIYLTSATLLTGSIAIGLVVDDTIHFMHNFQRYYARSGNLELAIQQTLETTGQAIFFTSIVLSCAFFIFIMNEVVEWSHFGLITGTCILFALLADIFLAPALMSLLFKNKKVDTADNLA